jgi:hypothetical protein
MSEQQKRNGDIEFVVVTPPNPTQRDIVDAQAVRARLEANAQHILSIAARTPDPE